MTDDDDHIAPMFFEKQGEVFAAIFTKNGIIQTVKIDEAALAMVWKSWFPSEEDGE